MYIPVRIIIHFVKFYLYIFMNFQQQLIICKCSVSTGYISVLSLYFVHGVFPGLTSCGLRTVRVHQPERWDSVLLVPQKP